MLTPFRVSSRTCFGILLHFSFFILKAAPFSGQGIGTTADRYTIIYKGDAKAINSNNTDPIGGYTQSNTAVSSVTDAIKTANTYYSKEVVQYYWSWYGFGDISLWSDYGTNKSIYDPCPYGYRVPKSGGGTASSWYGFPSTTWTEAIDGGAAWSGSGDKSWWPAAGRRNLASGTLEGVVGNGYYWSSTYSSTYLSYNQYFYSSGGINPSANSHRSFAYPVRCVQERGNASRGTWDLGALFVWVARPKASEWGGEA